MSETTTLRDSALLALDELEAEAAAQSALMTASMRRLRAASLTSIVKRLLGVDVCFDTLEWDDDAPSVVIEGIRFQVGHAGEWLVAIRPCEVSGCLNPVVSQSIQSLADVGRWLRGHTAYHAHYFGEGGEPVEESCENPPAATSTSPAHPETIADEPAYPMYDWPGLTKREAFAKAALQGIWAFPGDLGTDVETLAVASADRLIKALNTPVEEAK